MLIQYALFLPLGVFVALGVAFAAAGISLLRKIAACRRWPTVTGTVTRTDIESITEDDDSDAGRSHRSPRETTYTGVKIRYAFSVAGRDYQSTRRHVGRPILSGGTRTAARVLAKYPPNSHVTVHYNPANPAEAVLEPTNLGNVYFALTGVVMFGGIGLLGASCMWFIL
jgi:Protein of unknown function (DUF3592)